MLAQQFINCQIFRSIKETNWLISKGMYVLLFDAFNGCPHEKINQCLTDINRCLTDIFKI